MAGLAKVTIPRSRYKRNEQGQFLPVPATTPDERFWAQVNLNGPIPEHRPELGPCWLWTGCTNDSGYGILRIGTRNERVHRWIYQRLYGALPPRIEVLHRCDNPPCFRPTHLMHGTQAENMQDMYAKGRNWEQPRGERGPMPKTVHSVCTQCGREFMSARVARFCSQRCNEQDWQLRHRKSEDPWPLLERDTRVLTILGERPSEWLKPFDVESQPGVHHSKILNKLARRGLVDRRAWSIGPGQTRYEYRVHELGVEGMVNHG